MSQYHGIASFKIHKLQRSKTKSCVSCRDKKKKCTREFPACSVCIEKGTECHYESKNAQLESFQYGSNIDRIGTTSNRFKTDLKKKKRTLLFDEIQTATKSFSKLNENAIKFDQQPDQNQASNSISKLHPKNRVGPVFTPLFNSSLSLPNSETLVDFKLLNSFVPSKKEADILISRYRSSVHPLIPVIDWQTLYPMYANFWNNGSHDNLEFYVLLLCILYAASVSLFEENSVLHSKETFDKTELVKKMKYYIGATECAIAMLGYPKKVTITGLQASIIMYSVTRNDCRTDDFLSISSLVRCAQLIELNRDPKEYHNIENIKEIQLRRILWWQIVYLDCASALSSRLSPIISESEFDTQLPDEYKRHYKNDFILDQPIAFANGRFKWSMCTNKILKAYYGIKPKSAQMVGKIIRDIENLSFYCSSVIQRMVDPINVTPGEETFIQFGTLNISSLADRCLVLVDNLFENELKEGKKAEKKVVYSQKKCISTSSISDVGDEELDENTYFKHVQLLTGCINYGEMPKFAIFTWDIRKFQPIQTLLVMLRRIVQRYNLLKRQQLSFEEIKTQVRSDPSVKLVEKALEKLNYLSEHTTPLCEQRWKIVKDVKALIWNGLICETDSLESSGMVNGANIKMSDLQSAIQYNEIYSPTHSENDNQQFLSKNNNEGVMFLENMELQSEEANDGFEVESWDEVFSKMEDVIDENLHFKVWDDVSGHYLE